MKPPNGIKPLALKEWMTAIHLTKPYRTARALLIAVVSALILTTVMILGAISPTTHRLEPDFHVAFILVANIALFTPLCLFNFWLIRRGLKLSTIVPAGLVGSMAIATLFTLPSFWAETLIYGQGHTSNTFSITLIANAASALISFLVAQLLNDVTRQQQLVLENEQLRSENILTRYQTLQQQVSPHFLFNSLNTLDGLIGTDDDKAHNYLRYLAATFRYSMQDTREVTLGQELDFTHSYIYMMQIRHGQNLLIEEQVDPSYRSLHMPPISLQLLVENAIKHNIVSGRHPLKITIATLPSTPKSARPVLRVSNVLQPKSDSETPGGVGLSNLSLRYQLLYHADIEISRTDTHFTVDLPLI